MQRSKRSRKGDAARRQLEFDIVLQQHLKHRERFGRRLARMLRVEGDHMLWTGALSNSGYPKMNIRHLGRHEQLYVHRIVVMMRTGKPIPLEYDAGHGEGCPHRNCVRHVFLQHYSENAVTNVKPKEIHEYSGEAGEDCPF